MKSQLRKMTGMNHSVLRRICYGIGGKNLLNISKLSRYKGSILTVLHKEERDVHLSDESTIAIGTVA